MAFESFVLDGLALNDFTNFRIQEFDPGIAPKRWQWISGTDSDGAVLPEEAHYENAEMILTLRVAPQTTMDLALAKIGQIVDKLQECEQQPLGLAATWTPANSTKTLTAYILGGEVTGIPLTQTGDDAGWFLRNPAPVVKVKLYRRPFLYGAEVTSAATITNTDPVQILTVSGVTGDVPAEARLVVTDAATQSRRHLEWGAAWRYTPPSAILDSDNLVTTGFAGVGTTRAGAYDPGAVGNSVIRGTLTTSPVAICGTGNLGHIGSYRVKARVYPVITSTISTDVKVRLSWREGDGPLRSNSYTSPVATDSWCEVDLGVISIPEKLLGTQRWTGQIEAYSTAGGDTLDVDYIVLVPTAEGYGKGRAIQSIETPTTFIARDEFNQTAGVLTGKTAAVGGVWAGAGDAGDFSVETTGKTAQRTAVSDATVGRFAVSGAAALTAQLVQVDFKTSVLKVSRMGVIARYTDASNYLLCYVSINSLGVGSGILTIEGLVGGSVIAPLLGLSTPTLQAGTWYTMRLSVDTQGRVTVWFWPTATPGAVTTTTVYNSSLATGGGIASGKPGFVDYSSGATAATRNYDNFFAAVPTADAVVYSGRAAEIRHDSAIRQDSTGTYYGPINSYRGARFFLPPAGDENRPSTVVVKTRRNDIDVSPDDQIADSTTATVHYTPRWSVSPR